MVKPPRPDGAADGCGSAWVDEPGPEQSEPTLLDLQLRAASRRSGAGETEPSHVRAIEHARVAREVGRWVASVADVRRAAAAGGAAGAPPRPPPLPDLERLLHEWPPAVQAALVAAPLPSADLDVSLADYLRIACALLDVPVRANGLVHAAYALFALFLDARDHPGLAAYTLPDPVG